MAGQLRNRPLKNHPHDRSKRNAIDGGAAQALSKSAPAAYSVPGADAALDLRGLPCQRHADVFGDQFIGAEDAQTRPKRRQRPASRTALHGGGIRSTAVPAQGNINQHGCIVAAARCRYRAGASNAWLLIPTQLNIHRAAYRSD